MLDMIMQQDVPPDTADQDKLRQTDGGVQDNLQRKENYTHTHGHGNDNLVWGMMIIHASIDI